MKIEINQKSFKQSVKRVKNHLDKKDIAIQHSALLEAMSVFIGYENWNTLNAIIKREPHNLTRSISDLCYIICSEKHRENSVWANKGLLMLETIVETICFLNKEGQINIKEVDIIKDISLGNLLAIENANKKCVVELFLQDTKYSLKNVTIPSTILDKCYNCLESIYITSDLNSSEKQHGFLLLEVVKITR